MTAADPLPATMRAAVLSADGVVRVERIPVPRPRATEALLRVQACGVCHTDLHVVKGEVGFPKPCVLGHDVSGVVVELGDAGDADDSRDSDPGPDRLAVGDRVVGGFIMPCTECDSCQAGRDDLCERFFSMNRLKGTLYDGARPQRRRDSGDVFHGRHGRVLRVSGLRSVPASGGVAVRGIRDPRLCRDDRLRRGGASRRAVAGQHRRRGRHRRGRDERGADRPGGAASRADASGVAPSSRWGDRSSVRCMASAITLLKGDITAVAADTIVNAANSSLLGGGGVDGAIHRRGGPSILEECRELRRTRFPDGMPAGDAVATTAGRLPARWVIHTVGPVWSPRDDRSAVLESAYRRSLEVAGELGAASVVFPAISAGVYGWPADDAARIAVETVLASEFEGAVSFALFSDAMLGSFRTALDAALG
jgi:O-acetyl-ADP-ribose deacetylase (regulator of RNase III)